MTFFTLTIIFRHYFFHNIATYIKSGQTRGTGLIFVRIIHKISHETYFSADAPVPLEVRYILKRNHLLPTCRSQSELGDMRNGLG